jgi:hypothetical protein
MLCKKKLIISVRILWFILNKAAAATTFWRTQNTKSQNICVYIYIYIIRNPYTFSKSSPRKSLFLGKILTLFTNVSAAQATHDRLTVTHYKLLSCQQVSLNTKYESMTKLTVVRTLEEPRVVNIAVWFCYSICYSFGFNKPVQTVWFPHFLDREILTAWERVSS